MIDYKFVWGWGVFTGVPASTCGCVSGEADAIRSDMCGDIAALSGDLGEMEHTQPC